MALKWYGTEVKRIIRVRLHTNLEAALGVIADETNAAISVVGPPRSQPGEPPHIDTKELYGSYDLAIKPNALEGSVGSSVEHAVYMELGTPTVKARPHFLPTILAQLQRVARLLAR